MALTSGLQIHQEQQQINFKAEYVQDKNFANGFAFKDVSDIAINSVLRQVFVLQRSLPVVTVWDTNGTLIFVWSTIDLGFPHSITLNGSNPSTARVWITDMAGPTIVKGSYGHCVKVFSYYGKYIRSIGSCGKYSNGSSLDPIQFDKITDISWSSNSGLYYITDGDLGGQNNRIVVLNSTFKLVEVWNGNNQPGDNPLQFHLPHTIKIDTCGRIWITDALNKRVQVVSDRGTFLGELNGFGDRLIYGLDFLSIGNKSSILLTVKRVEDNQTELLYVPVKMDCSNIKDINGDCSLERTFILSQGLAGTDSRITSSMLHSVTVDSLSGDIYLTILPGNTPPLKFYAAPHPPVRNPSQSVCTDNPPLWLEEWNATVLLTPYGDEGLLTALVMYKAKDMAMYVRLGGNKSTLNSEILTVKDQTYTIERDRAGNVRCLGPKRGRWKTPDPDWLNGRNCKCQGMAVSAGVETVLWECPNHKFVDWFWYDITQKPWRIFLNNNSNPSMIPVLGEYTMVNFASHGKDITDLNYLLDVCVHALPNSTFRGSRPNYLVSGLASYVEGFLYGKCSGTTQLRNWPNQFYLTATMIPVNDYDPMPTSVIYDWTRYSQHTMMYSTSNTAITSAYLISNSTYIVQSDTDKKVVKCISHMKFGPPHPNWMFLDKCKCMGVIDNNAALSPWPSTIIAVCPLEDSRVFWTWFSVSTDYYPVIFFETLSPPGEGTSLAFAEYHEFYSHLLVDLQDFEVPSKCKQNY